MDALSFAIGFVSGVLFMWLLSRIRPLLTQIRENARERREAAQVRRTSGLEDNHRRMTLRRAQGMHLAASLFSLDELLQEPRLMTPPPRVEPGVVGIQDDIISQTLPYVPSWPELAALYRAPSIGMAEAIAGGSNIVIVGEAGAGKTVALAHLASLAANLRISLEGSELEAVPYFYHVADLQLPFDSSRDPASLLINAASEHAPLFDLRRLPRFIQQTLSSGQALLLVDGFDELEPAGQSHVVDWFKALSQAYPRVRIVTTGCADRLNGLVRLGFSPLALMTWDAARVSHFIQHWGELWSRTVAVESGEQTGPEQVDPILLNTWLAVDNTGLTPFELTLKVWGAYAGDSVGPRVLDAIATHVRRLAPTGTPVAALELLAMQVVLTLQPVFDPRQARAWVKQYDIVEDRSLESAETLTTGEGEENLTLTDSQRIRIKKSKAGEAVPSYGLLSKMVDSGLLVSHSNNKMRFLHPVLNGYLAGQAIGDNDADTTLLALPEWDGKTVSLRYLAARGDATAVADILLKQSDLPLHNQCFTVARWLRDAPREAAWRSPAFARLLAILQAEGQPLGLRGQALAAFVASGDPGAVTLFRQLLGARSFELIPLAALGSGALKDVKAIDVLEELLQAPAGAVRRAVCLALVAIGTERSLESVARALLQGDEELRRAAAEALANDPVEGHAMLREGATLADILVRRAVVHGLARVGQPWAIETLQRMQVQDDQWAVRNLANQYLEQMQHIDLRVPRPLTPPSESPWLIAFAGKQRMGIPRGGPATDVLLSAFKSGETEERLAALPYLKRVANEGIVGVLYNAMYGEDPDVREAAFLAVEEIGADGFRLPHPNQFGLG
jgi:HEAT repeat protein